MWLFLHFSLFFFPNESHWHYMTWTITNMIWYLIYNASSLADYGIKISFLLDTYKSRLIPENWTCSFPGSTHYLHQWKTGQNVAEHIVKSLIQLKVVFYTRSLCHKTIHTLQNSQTGLNIIVFKPLSHVLKIQ